MLLLGTLTSTWDHIQGFLFPMLREEVGPLTAQHERLVVVLDLARIEAFVRMWPGACRGARRLTTMRWRRAFPKTLGKQSLGARAWTMR